MQSVFQKHKIKVIAINDAVDTSINSDNDFAPFLQHNFNSFLCKKIISKKIKAVKKHRQGDGERVATKPPCGS